jgi:hypothetical protein
MGSNVNEDLIQKTLTTSAFFTGGELNPTQQTQFVEYVKEYSFLLKQVRVERMKQPRADIDKIFVGEPITRSIEEGDDTTNSDYKRPKFGKISITTQGVQSAWAQTTKTLQSNIQQDKLEETMVRVFVKRMATDYEDLFWNGDTSLGGSDPTSLLRKRCDGISKLTEGCHVIDAAGAPISKALWAAALRKMPKMYASDPGLRWFVSKGVQNDWRNVVSDRPTPQGDAAMNGQDLQPQGIPWLPAPVIPDDLALEIAEATSAQVIGTAFGPFEILDSGAGQNNKVKVDVDNAGAVTVTLLKGVWQAVEIAAMINSAVGLEGVASATREGQLVLTSATTTATSEIDVQAVGTSAYAELGLTIAVTNGVAAGGGGDVAEGTEILLCNPQVLIWAILDEARMYAEFNKNRDQIETVVYSSVDVKVENLDQIVKIKNLRRADLD